jgi:hypothetical protein
MLINPLVEIFCRMYVTYFVLLFTTVYIIGLEKNQSQLAIYIRTEISFLGSTYSSEGRG